MRDPGGIRRYAGQCAAGARRDRRIAAVLRCRDDPGWARGAIAWAVDNGIVEGYPDGAYRPDARISRTVLAAMLARSLKLKPGNDKTGFADDSDIPAWGKPYADALYAERVIVGDAQRFLPHRPTTRAEVAVALLWIKSLLEARD